MNAISRVGHFVICILIYSLGAVLVGGVEANPNFGYRTEASLADPTVWTAMNYVGGLACLTAALIGFAFFGRFRRFSKITNLVFVAVSLIFIALPFISAETCLKLYSSIENGHRTFNAQTLSIALPLAISVMCIGAAGAILATEDVPRQHYFGFRFKSLMRTEENWRTGNRIGGFALHSTCAIGLAGVTLSMVYFSKLCIVAIGIATLIISPVIACIAIWMQFLHKENIQ